MSSLKERLRQQYELKDSIKEYKGYKVKSPEETIERIESAFNKINLGVEYNIYKEGALKKLSPFQCGNSILHPLEDKNITLLKTNGKGVSSILSRASATAELIERFTGYGLAKNGNIKYYNSRIKLDEIWKKKRENNKILEKEFEFNSIDTEGLIKKEENEKYNKMAKSVCYSLTKDKFYCFPEEFIVNLCGSNGLASGNTYEEATLHAIFELIERLSGCYFLDNIPNCKKISKESVTHPTLKKLMKTVSSLDVDYEMLDFSFLFNIPVIVTIFDNEKWDFPPYPYSTTSNMKYPKMIIGVDTDPQDAAMRCFTEFLQGSFPIYFAKNNEVVIREVLKTANFDIPPNFTKMFSTGLIWMITNNQPLDVNLRKYLAKKREEKPITEITKLYDLNQKIEIKNIVEKLKESKIETYVCDITNPILDFPVALTGIAGGKEKINIDCLSTYMHMVIGKKNRSFRSKMLEEKIKGILNEKKIIEIIKKEEWCKNVDQAKFIDEIKKEILFFTEFSKIWGVEVNKFYFMGMLYLRMKKYKEAENCFNAALWGETDNLSALIGLAYIYSKNKRDKEYEEIMNHIKNVNKNQIDINEMIKKMDDPVVNPNPFEPCDLKCKEKNKKYLCEKCFFNYVSDDIYMKKHVI